MRTNATRGLTTMLAGFLLASGLGLPAARGEVTHPSTPPQGVARRSSEQDKRSKPGSTASWHARRGPAFQRNWGVDIVGVRRVSSGLMLRFDYRVVDPEKAAVLTSRKTRPYLIDEATQIALAVPAMENIGELRQVAPLETSRTYFMIFGNPGGLVKKGGRVTLVMGNFRAEGLEVD